MNQTEPNPLQVVPRPEEVRARLAETLREARVLRSLLRVSQRAAQELQRREEEPAE